MLTSTTNDPHLLSKGCSGKRWQELSHTASLVTNVVNIRHIRKLGNICKDDTEINKHTHDGWVLLSTQDLFEMTYRKVLKGWAGATHTLQCQVVHDKMVL